MTGVPVISDKRADQHHGTYVSPPRCITRQLVITSTWISRDHLYLTFPALYANQHVHHRDRMPIGVITFAEFSRRPWYSRFCHKKCYTELVKFLLKQQLAKSSDFIREFWGNFSPSSPRHCCWLQLLTVAGSALTCSMFVFKFAVGCRTNRSPFVVADNKYKISRPFEWMNDVIISEAPTVTDFERRWAQRQTG